MIIHYFRLLKLIKAKSLYFKLSRVGIVSHELNLNYRNKLNSLIRRSKKKYFLDSFARCRGDISKTWKLIRGALSQGVSDRSIKSLIIENVEEASEMKLAEEFNNFFSSVAVDIYRLVLQRLVCLPSTISKAICQILFFCTRFRKPNALKSLLR